MCWNWALNFWGNFQWSWKLKISQVWEDQKLMYFNLIAFVSSITKLDLSSSPELDALPANLSSLEALRVIDLRHSPSLATPAQLRKLSKLDLEVCNSRIYYQNETSQSLSTGTRHFWLPACFSERAASSAAVSSYWHQFIYETWFAEHRFAFASKKKIQKKKAVEKVAKQVLYILWLN